MCSQLVLTNQSLSVVDSDMPKLRIIGWVVRCQLGKTSRCIFNPHEPEDCDDTWCIKLGAEFCSIRANSQCMSVIQRANCIAQTDPFDDDSVCQHWSFHFFRVLHVGSLPPEAVLFPPALPCRRTIGAQLKPRPWLKTASLQVCWPFTC